MKILRFNKSPEYNEHDGAWWLTSDNEGPIEVVIKVEAESTVANHVASAIAENVSLLELDDGNLVPVRV